MISIINSISCCRHFSEAPGSYKPVVRRNEVMRVLLSQGILRKSPSVPLEMGFRAPLKEFGVDIRQV